MTTDDVLLGLGLVLTLAVGSQLVATPIGCSATSTSRSYRWPSA